MKKIFRFLYFLAIIIAIAPGSSFAADTVKTAWLSELEALACWNAHQKKIDKDIIFDMKLYPTGKRLADSFSQWDIASCGLIPAFDAILKKEAVIIGFGVDETIGNTLFVKKDSPILTVKGNNPEFPEVYGSADTVRGKTILCTFNSNAHMLVLTWLKIVGLTDQDIRLIDVKPEEALSAFQKGMGDVLALWAPDSYLALKNELQPIAKAKDCNLNFLTVILANKNFLEKYPEKVKKFLSIYYDSVDNLKALDNSELAEEYSKFLWSFANIDLSKEDSKNITDNQTILSKTEIQKFFENNETSFIYKTIQDGIEYYAMYNAIARHDKEFLLKLSYLQNLL